MLKIIEELNQNNTIKIKTFNGLSDIVPIATGIRQADSLSTTLFNVIMNEIIEKEKKWTSDIKWEIDTLKYCAMQMMPYC